VIGQLSLESSLGTDGYTFYRIVHADPCIEISDQVIERWQGRRLEVGDVITFQDDRRKFIYRVTVRNEQTASVTAEWPD